MVFIKILQIHAVQLVPGEDHVVVRILGTEVDEVLPHGIGGSHVPA